MDRIRQLRIASVLSFLYVVLFVALQVYGALQQPSGGPAAPQANASNTQIDQYFGLLLAFVHRHLGYFTTTYALISLNYLFLLGTAVGIYLVLRPYRPTAALILACVGIISILVVVVGTVLLVPAWSDFSTRYVSASTTAARLSVAHSFDGRYITSQLIIFFGSIGLALWLALIGVTLLRLEGMRSLNGWATIVAGVLAVSGIPSLVIWVLGAGIALWRVSRAAYQPPLAATTGADLEVVDMDDRPIEDEPTPARSQQVSTARKERQHTVATRGGARGRKRR
jgi:hypothetical protein